MLNLCLGGNEKAEKPRLLWTRACLICMGKMHFTAFTPLVHTDGQDLQPLSWS